MVCGTGGRTGPTAGCKAGSLECATGLLSMPEEISSLLWALAWVGHNECQVPEAGDIPDSFLWLPIERRVCVTAGARKPPSGPSQFGGGWKVEERPET